MNPKFKGNKLKDTPKVSRVKVSFIDEITGIETDKPIILIGYDMDFINLMFSEYKKLKPIEKGFQMEVINND